MIVEEHRFYACILHNFFITAFTLTQSTLICVEVSHSIVRRGKPVEDHLF